MSIRIPGPPRRALPALFILALAGCIQPAPDSSAPWALGPSISSTDTPDYSISATPFMPGAQDTEVVYDTPTPNPPAELPPLREESDLYTVQPGDTLLRIAQRYGVTIEQIIAQNDLENPDLLEVGQVLVIPAPAPLATGPGFKIVPDSELVNGPSAIGFDSTAFIESAGGFLAGYMEEVDGAPMSGSEIVAEIARDFSVNPRLLLALIEYQSGWVTRSNPSERTYPMGLVDGFRQGLYRQLAWAADNLNRGYYLWRVGSLSAYILTDGSLVPVDPTINAGTVGVQYFFSRLHGHAAWTEAISEGGLFATYRSFFGYPFIFPVEPLIPDGLAQPDFQLPFERNVSWFFTGGPHGGWGDGSAWAALDFAPPGEALGCVQSNAWVTAIADGLIVRSGKGRVVQDLDGDGNEQTGWVILYMHIETRGRVDSGEMLTTGDRIGHPSCEGGFSTGTHLHIARKYNGEWISADGPETPFVMDGWTSTGVGFYYNGWLIKGERSVVAENGRFEENEISR
ncbi:MAG TPA: LysM peptidoglycan-binding domain-containing protein [Anaerolineales bacterium]|nr:LysM peptidoglycan-binding domain-containing protein [Anaerolineales bacterium]